LSSEKSLASEPLAFKIRKMKHPLSISCFFLIPVVSVLAQESSKSSTATLPSIPPPMSVPAAGPTNDAPYAPQPIVQGGVVIPLYPPDSPHLKKERIREAEVYNMSKAVPGRINSITNIHNPSIEVHTVEGGINTGAAIILAAGGGHRTLNVGSESADFVPFFYNYGVNTIILRNRLRNDGYNVQADAVNDALQAIRLVRLHAKQWNIDPNKIGIMGFSAGAELAAPTAIQFEDFDKKNGDSSDPLAGVSSRPDFIGLVYPGPSPFARGGNPPIPRNCPPAFIVCGGSGDRVHAIWADEYLAAMLQAGIPNVEMHIYGNGRHPGELMSDGSRMTGGLTAKNGIPFGTWQDRFIDWFRDLGFLQKPGVETKAAKDIAAYSSQPPPRPLFVPGDYERRSSTEKR
jgi:acetyl esterase/lipase